MLKQLAAQILYRNNNPSDLQQNLDQYYIYMLVITDSKLCRSKPSNKKSQPKNICIINFQNHASEYIKLSHIIAQLPRELQNKELVITYKLTNIIRNKILNYKHAVNSIYVKEKILFNLNTNSCACEHSPFIDSHHKHNITGDLRFARDSKLQKLLTKSPNYREPRSANLNEAFAEITTGFNNCNEKLTSKSKHDVNNFDQWKKAKKWKNVKIEILKTKIKPSFKNPLLPDPDVLAYLERLHRNYVIIPINKASKVLYF